MDLDIFKSYNFNLELIEWLRKELKKSVIWQDDIIDDIIEQNFFKELLRIEKRPFSPLILFGNSGTGKNLIFKTIWNYLNKETWSFQTTVFDCSTIYASEIWPSLFGVSQWFKSNSSEKCLLESIYEKILDEDSTVGGHIIIFSEIEKMKGYYNKSNFELLFNTVFQLIEEWECLINTVEGKIKIEFNNFIFCFDSNMFFEWDYKKQEEDKIWFSIEKKESNDSIQTITKNELKENIKSLLPNSIYNRIKHNIYVMNNFKKEDLFKIYSIEHEKVINSFNKYLDKQGIDAQLWLVPNKKDFENAMNNIDESEWARYFRFYCENKLRIDIIKKHLIPLQKMMKNRYLEDSKRI